MERDSRSLQLKAAHRQQPKEHSILLEKLQLMKLIPNHQWQAQLKLQILVKQKQLRDFFRQQMLLLLQAQLV
jgi:hypothetical protein